MRTLLSGLALALLVVCADGLLASLSGDSDGGGGARILFGTGTAAAVALLLFALQLSRAADERELTRPGRP